MNPVCVCWVFCFALVSSLRHHCPITIMQVSPMPYFLFPCLGSAGSDILSSPGWKHLQAPPSSEGRELDRRMVSSEAHAPPGHCPGKSSSFSALSWVKEPDASSPAEGTSALGKLNMVFHFHCLVRVVSGLGLHKQTNKTAKTTTKAAVSGRDSCFHSCPPAFSTHSHQPNGGPTDWMESKSTFVCKNCSQMFYTEKGLSSHMCFHSDQWPSPRGKQEQQVKDFCGTGLDRLWGMDERTVSPIQVKGSILAGMVGVT